MTSKDFQLKIKYWVSWLNAFDLFQNPLFTSIWKISLLEYKPGTYVFYSYRPYPKSLDFYDNDDLDMITIERYPRSKFNIDFGFFKTNFLNKLSYYQRQVIENDSRFTNILNFIKNEQK